MQPNTVPPANAPTPTSVPVIPAALVRKLARGVSRANVIVAGIALLVIEFSGRGDWWLPLACSVVIGFIGVIASVAVLSMAAGRTVDWLVTFVMGVAGVRMFVSLIGLVIAVKGLNAHPEATAILICCFYAVTLIVETGLLVRTAGSAKAVGGTHV